MKLLDKASLSAAVKLALFLVVTTLATALLAVTIGNLTFSDKTPYRAVFSDVTGVNKGDDVRIAGVRVGSVSDIDLTKDNQATISFEIDSTVTLTEGTEATIRYRNLVGQRYISLSQGVGSSQALAEDGTIPLSQTSPALDLTVLFNGFKPLFRALSPADVNQLAYEIIQVFQGEGGTVETLLAQTSSLTDTLANRDKLIGDVITNLNDVLATINARDTELSQTIITLQQFTTGLKNDRQAILGSLDSISELAVETAGLVSDARPALTEDIYQLRRLTTVLDRNKASIDQDLQILPLKLNKVGHTATYGSWFNFYLCNFNGTVQVDIALLKQLQEQGLIDPIEGLAGVDFKDGDINVHYAVDAERCDL